MFSIFKRSRRIRAWNKGKLMGQKPPLKPKEIWSIRIRLQMSKRRRDLALFNLALDSQAPSVRSNEAESEGCVSRRSSRQTGDDSATEDTTTGAVRDHISDTLIDS